MSAHPYADLIAWCSALRSHEEGAGALYGRVQLTRDAVCDIIGKLGNAIAAANSFTERATPMFHLAQVRALLDVGCGCVAGMFVELVDACEPPLRYVPHRDPLLFGASA